ncbi:hypothetical protein J2Z21_004432 [Streptomyces griseochromogenes]|uniref:Uncharacterized protein n=1 Tax=Streptomyces griseochromogenes TaxID=68214 RepID=A0ABS4LVK1_9ACTN|nr:hypothetical protein [Streptomyces griseochromogenes]
MTQDATQDALLKLLSEQDGGVLVTLRGIAEVSPKGAMG